MKMPVTALVASLILGEGSLVMATTPNSLPSSDWHSILAAHDAAKRAFVTNEDGTHSGFTPSQGWHVQFDGRGFAVSPNSADWQWGLQLQSYAFGTECTDLDAPASTSSEVNRLTYRWDDTLQEWFVNSRNGLLQGWTIARLPEEADPSQLLLVLAVMGDLQPHISEHAESISFNTKSGAAALTYSDLHAWDADGKQLRVFFEGTRNQPREFALQIDASNARFPITIDPIAQQAYLKASNTDRTDYFGVSAAISGDSVVIGATGEDSNATGVNGDQANSMPGNSGAAYVFIRTGTTWTQQAYLKASNTGPEDSFGYAVSISGDTIVVGAYGEDSNATGIGGNSSNNDASEAGAAYIFVRNGSTWTQQAYLKASNAEAGDFFGYAVAVSGNTILVGAPFEASNATTINGNQTNNSADDSGAVYVFERAGDAWTQQAYLKASNAGLGDDFGFAVTISGNIAVVGAPDEASNGSGGANNYADGSGAAYVFVRSGATWGQQAYLKASNTGSSDQFGAATAISGDSLVIGAPYEDSSATGVNGNGNDNSLSSSGAAYVFKRNGATWTEQAYLKASNSHQGDLFGNAVAISGETLVVGTYGSQSEAAYIFERTGDSWSQLPILKASNTEFLDAFGYSVGVSNGSVIIGAFGEGSGATGINGNQTDNSANLAGAAYVFVIENPLPTLSAKGKTRLSTSRSKVVLRGTSTDATLVEYKAGKGGFKTAKGSAGVWKIPVRLKSTRTIVSVRASGPGGTSPLLKFKIRRQ